MATYTVELTIKNATEVRLYGLDEDQKAELDDLGGIEEVDSDYFFDNDFCLEYETIVMNVDALYGNETFSLEVKDEDGKVVYETTDPESIIRYPYDNEETDEEVEGKPSATPVL